MLYALLHGTCTSSSSLTLQITCCYSNIRLVSHPTSPLRHTHLFHLCPPRAIVFLLLPFFLFDSHSLPLAICPRLLDPLLLTLLLVHLSLPSHLVQATYLLRCRARPRECHFVLVSIFMPVLVHRPLLQRLRISRQATCVKKSSMSMRDECSVDRSPLPYPTRPCNSCISLLLQCQQYPHVTFRHGCSSVVSCFICPLRARCGPPWWKV